MDEEARAIAYRRQDARRRDFQRWLDDRLAGDPAAARAVHDNWAPIRQWLRDRLEPRVETIDDDNRADRA